MNGRGLLVVTVSAALLSGCGYTYDSTQLPPAPSGPLVDMQTREAEWFSGVGGLAFDAVLNAMPDGSAIIALARTAQLYPPPIHKDLYITSMNDVITGYTADANAGFDVIKQDLQP